MLECSRRGCTRRSRPSGPGRARQTCAKTPPFTLWISPPLNLGGVLDEANVLESASPALTLTETGLSSDAARIVTRDCPSSGLDMPQQPAHDASS
jgi:hypothetical protein